MQTKQNAELPTKKTLATPSRNISCNKIEKNIDEIFAVEDFSLVHYPFKRESVLRSPQGCCIGKN